MIDPLKGNPPHHELVRKINELVALHNVKTTHPQMEMRAQIVQIVKQCGIPANIKGYYHLQTAIQLVIDDLGYLGAVTKRLYPEIARTHSTTGTRVERAIRHAIEVGFTRGAQDVLEQIFQYTYGYNKSKPTNSEFIGAIAEYIQLNQVKKEPTNETNSNV